MDPKQDQPILDTPVSPASSTPLSDFPVSGEFSDMVSDVSDAADESYEAAKQSTEKLKEMEDDYADIKKMYDEAMGGESVANTLPPVPSDNPLVEPLKEVPMTPVIEETQAMDIPTPSLASNPMSSTMTPMAPMTEMPTTPMAETPGAVASNSPMESLTPTEPVTPQMPWQQNPSGGTPQMPQ